MDDKTIGDVLQACGSDIDAAIARLTHLRLSAQQAEAAEQQATLQAPAQTQQTGAVKQAAPQQTADRRPKTSAEWVEGVVQQMAGATSMEDARTRAAQVLQAFEQALLERSASAQATTGSAADLQNQLQQLQKENGILKRAVAIQNGRLQELGAKDAELQQLRRNCEEYQGKVHSLELSNYSLAMHLRQATDSISQLSQGQRRPDVF
jgi:predicted RNase H-like nuclease (RuvC/YqgF family)